MKVQNVRVLAYLQLVAPFTTLLLCMRVSEKKEEEINVLFPRDE